MDIDTGLNLGSITVTATQGAKRVPLSVSKRGAGQFVATGQLTSGQWTLTIDYGTPAMTAPDQRRRRWRGSHESRHRANPYAVRGT